MCKKILKFCICMLLLAVESASAQLPVVRMHADSALSGDFSSGYFYVNDSIAQPAEIRYRGATAMSMQKKSYAIKLKDAQGKNCDMSLLGMRSDNYWILDAMAVDVARMRSRVSMDLWNDFSRESYVREKKPGMQNGTHGRFVELYMDDDYQGIYCLTERIDRKQLKLMKADSDGMHGALYKSSSWSTLYSTDSAFYDYDNHAGQWHGWEMSYPDVEDVDSVDWEPLVSLVYWLSYSDQNEMTAELEQKVDMPVWQDYYLMMEFICAEDNICKNQYVYFYDVQDEDRMLGVAPWDMDHSWGRDYAGRITEKTQADFDLVTTRNCVARLLVENEDLLEKTFQERYAELRTTFFSAQMLKNRFRVYFDLFSNTGAADREVARWSGTDGIELDFDGEYQYICDWIDNRLVYMDAKYGYSEQTSITRYNRLDNKSRIYNLLGQCVAEDGVGRALSRGVYIDVSRGRVLMIK